MVDTELNMHLVPCCNCSNNIATKFVSNTVYSLFTLITCTNIHAVLQYIINNSYILQMEQHESEGQMLS